MIIKQLRNLMNGVLINKNKIFKHMNKETRKLKTTHLNNLRINQINIKINLTKICYNNKKHLKIKATNKMIK